MRYHVLLAATSLLLASCASTKPLPQYSEAEKQAQRESISYWQPAPTKSDSTSGPRVEPGSQADLIRRIFEGHPPVVQVEAAPDSLRFVKVERQPSLLRRLFPVKQKDVPDIGVGNIPRKCKGCTFIVGDHNTVAGKKAQALGAGASNIQTGKKSGDIITADSGAIVSKVGGPGNNQTTRGNNNTPQLTAPVQQAPDWRATLAKPVGYALASLGSMFIVGGCIFLIAAYKRRNKLAA